jgi:hypothetical protein
MDKNKKTFIPRDKPKSWIIAILSGLGGLFIAGPLIFLGYFLEWEFLKYLGMVLFAGFWLDFMLMGLLFMVGSLQGKYKNMSEKDWQDQVW